MPNNDHEPVLSALLSYLETATAGAGFQTYSRKELFLTDVSAQPALFLRQIGGDYEFANVINQRVTLDCEIWIACKAAGDRNVPSDTQLNTLKKAVLDAFAPDDRMTGRFTIGGVAFWCRVQGRSDQYPGDIGNQSMCVLPVKITLP